MKDDVNQRKLPPCLLSTQCLLHIDELDENGISVSEAFSAEDSRDGRVVERLRTHIRTCATCTAILAQARKVRAEQRRALLGILNEGEQRVPSTAGQIMAAIKSERQSSRQISASFNNRQGSLVLPPPQWQDEAEVAQPKRSRVLWHNLLSVAAVAALLLLSFGLFRYVLPHHSTGSHTTSTPTVGTQPTIVPSNEWSSVVMAYVLNGHEVIANYDPISGKSQILATPPYTGAQSGGTTTVEGVSHSGYQVLYSTYDGTKTDYYVYPQTSGPLLTVSGKGGSAIWSYDDSSIFISTSQGVVKIDPITHSSQTLLPTLASTELLSEREDGYLYYVRSYDGTPYGSEGMLNRVNLNRGDTQRITPCLRGSNFWLSPRGTTVYYMCVGNASTLYAVNSDGANPHSFRTDAGTVVGYAADGSPLTFVNLNGNYQIVQRSLSGSQNDHTLLDDVVPATETVTAENVAVAPYGPVLLAKSGGNNAGPEKFWYGDLRTGKSQSLPLPQGASNVQVIGWDKLLVSTAPMPTPQPTSGGSSFSSWHDILVAEDDTSANALKLLDYDTTNAASFLVTSNKPSLNAVVDGISPDGKNILYQDTSAGKTFYWTQTPLPRTGYFYTQSSSQGGNALWLPDNRHVLILSLGASVIEVDVQTGQAQPFLRLPLASAGRSISVAKLAFYRSNGDYLYFISDDSILYRVQVSIPGAGALPLTSRQPNTLYWLSPDGSLIYFANSGAAGQSGVYAVNSDGTNLRQLRPYPDARPIGYAADGSLVVMRYVGSLFQVVQLGANQAQDRVLLSNVAPGATSLCDNPVNPGIVPLCDSSIALAPLSSSLVVEAGYADGSHKIWSINLQTGQYMLLATPLRNVSIQLIGWNEI